MTFEAFGHMTNGICLIGISRATDVIPNTTHVIPNTTHVIPDLIRNPFFFCWLEKWTPGQARGDVGRPG